MSVHGGNLREASEQYGLSQFIDFSANINPFGVPKKLLEALADAIENDLTHYPDPDCKELCAAISSMHGVDISNVLCGNGASEILFLSMQVLTPKRVLIPSPAFIEYTQYAELFGAQVTPHLLPCDDWVLRLDDLPSLKDYDAVIIGNPNNPTSTLLDIDTMKALAKMCKESETALIIDEAFMELTIGGQSMCEYIDEFPNMLIVRAFTKSLAIPGLRLGYVLGNPELLRVMHSKQITWSVNALAQSVARALPDIGQYMSLTNQWLMEELPEYYARMSAIDGITCFKPHTNFMLWKLERDDIDLRDSMARRGILIRPCANFAGLDGSYFRTAVSSRQNNEKLYSALHDVLSGG